MLSTHQQKKKKIVDVREARRALEVQAEAGTPVASAEEDDNPRTPPKTKMPKRDQIKYYSPFSQTLLQQAKVEFRRMIFTLDGFPDDEVRARFGKAAWKNACELKPTEFNKGQYSVITVFLSLNVPSASLQKYDKYILRIVRHHTAGFGSLLSHPLGRGYGVDFPEQLD